MGCGVFREIGAGVVVFLTAALLFGACSSNKSTPAGVAPEALARESLKNIATLAAQANASVLGFPGSVSDSKSISSGRGWHCPEIVDFENDCLKLSGSCSSQGAAMEMSGTVEFKACLRESGLGLAGFSGALSFRSLWSPPPSCVKEAPDASCPSTMVRMELSNPVNLSVRFAELDSLAVNAVQAVLEERWRMAGFGAWRLTVTAFGAVAGGRVFQCSGEPVTCAVSAAPTTAPPPQTVDSACLDIPECDSDLDCDAFLQKCPETAEFLDGFGHALKCELSRGRKSCFPMKLAPPDDGGGGSTGSCSRTGMWGEVCPISFGGTVNGQGLECPAVDCQSREFSQFNGGPCGYPCYQCEYCYSECQDNYRGDTGAIEACKQACDAASHCEECDTCRTRILCVNGCCAFDQDGDGYIYAGYSGGGPGDQVLLDREDNCDNQANPDQADADLDCVGDACDNCPQSANNDQSDRDFDGVGDACDNCPLVANGPNPVWECGDRGCAQVPSSDNQKDSDGDGIGDACQGDMDGDGVPDESDNCPLTHGTDQGDRDRDGVGDLCDNCPRTPNPDQTDLVNDSGDPYPDGRGDACNGDSDEDGILDKEGDNCTFDYNPDQANQDEDPMGDACDLCPRDYSPYNQPEACGEGDYDGVPNLEDNCPKQYNPDQAPYAEGGGFPGQACSYCLISQTPWGWDADSDGIVDTLDCDNCPGVENPGQEDADGDLIGDACDNCRRVPNFGQRDSDSDGIGDACAFCDNNGTCGEKEDYFNCPDDCPPVCGNAENEKPAEACDDGKHCGDGTPCLSDGDCAGIGDELCITRDGDGCDSNCTLTGCGNGIQTKDEVCEDGNLTDGDGCDSNCTPTGCGNGVVTRGEACDDGNKLDDDYCYSDCTLPACGDGKVTVGEECGEPGMDACPGGAACASCKCACETQDACAEGFYCDLSKSCQACETSAFACVLDQQCMDIAAKCGAPPDMQFVCGPADKGGTGYCIQATYTCGDGTCECRSGETEVNCPQDCPKGSCDIVRPPSCGDRLCDCGAGENYSVCPADCPQTETSCGDGIDNDCDGLLECVRGGDPDCPVEDTTLCPPSGCACDPGNYCDANQACQSCDSPSFACASHAECMDIAGQCGAPPGYLFYCEKTEGIGNCVAVPCTATETICNDGLDNDCDGMVDCIGGDQDCLEMSAEDPNACPPPPDPFCGDGICNGAESCDTCPSDCTKCAAPLPKS